jgi:hypothetical protein
MLLASERPLPSVRANAMENGPAELPVKEAVFTETRKVETSEACPVWQSAANVTATIQGLNIVFQRMYVLLVFMA